MKRIFTLLASVVAVFGMSAAPKMHVNQDFHAQGLLPETEARLQQRVASASVDMKSTPEAKPFQKVWYDEKNKCYWRVTLELLGHVGDLYSWGNDASGKPMKPTLEQVPYYGVMAGFEKEYDDPNSPGERTYWVLWWPTIYEHSQFVDNWYTGVGNVEPDLNPVPFDAFCNNHENPEYIELTYCSKFQEVPDDEMPYPDFQTEERDGNYYIIDPTPTWWGMHFFTGYIGNNECTSGLINGMGSKSVFTFNEWNPLDQWLDMDIRMFTNGVRRSEVSFSGKARVQGWTQSLLALPEYGDVHIFNAGINSSEIAGVTDYYGGTWGPLQQYFLFGIGKYVEFVESLWEGKFETEKVRIQDIPDKIIADGVDPTTIQNYFWGILFSNVGSEPNEGTWNMVDPVKIGQIYQVTPVANCIVPYAVESDVIPDGFVSVYEGDTDFCTTGSVVNIGTTKGLQLLLNNGYDYYEGFYDKDIVYHYDVNNMVLTKTFSSVGTKEPTSDSVNEIAVSEDAPVYYNLQGVRIANPEKGIVIKVQGNKATKLFL